MEQLVILLCFFLPLYCCGEGQRTLGGLFFSFAATCRHGHCTTTDSDRLAFSHRTATYRHTYTDLHNIHTLIRPYHVLGSFLAGIVTHPLSECRVWAVRWNSPGRDAPGILWNLSPRVVRASEASWFRVHWRWIMKATINVIAAPTG